MKPKLSIIMPAFNASKYIQSSISSILCSYYQDFELIIVDDCSLDDTRKLINDFALKDERVKVISNTTNLGPNESIKRSLSICRGDYVTFLDSDDLVQPDLYDFYVKTFESNKTIDLICVNFNYYYKNKVVANPIRIKDKIYTKNELLFDVFPIYRYPQMDPCRWGKAFKLDLLRKAFLNINTELIIGDDQSLLFHYFLFVENIFVCNKFFIEYRQREGSIMHSDRLNQMMPSFDKMIESVQRVTNDNFGDQMRWYYFILCLRFIKANSLSWNSTKQRINNLKRYLKKNKIKFFPNIKIKLIYILFNFGLMNFYLYKRKKHANGLELFK